MVMNDSGMNKQKNLSRTRLCFKRIFDDKVAQPLQPSGTKQAFLGVNIG